MNLTNMTANFGRIFLLNKLPAIKSNPTFRRKTLDRVNPQKAAGPDNISGWMLKECADLQLVSMVNRGLLSKITAKHN